MVRDVVRTTTRWFNKKFTLFNTAAPRLCRVNTGGFLSDAPPPTPDTLFWRSTCSLVAGTDRWEEPCVYGVKREQQVCDTIGMAAKQFQQTKAMMSDRSQIVEIQPGTPRIWRER